MYSFFRLPIYASHMGIYFISLITSWAYHFLLRELGRSIQHVGTVYKMNIPLSEDDARDHIAAIRASKRLDDDSSDFSDLENALVM